MVAVYFTLNRARMLLPAKTFLVAGSLFFYSWWNWAYLPLILLSIFFNYSVGSALSPERKEVRISRRRLLIIAISANVLALGYFKYSDFFIANSNLWLSTQIPLLKLALPLAISFFTFQQIAYLVDSYKGETYEYDFLNYCLFVTFFPQLIAGPIVHHKEMMSQFVRGKEKILNWKNCYYGLLIISMGLFKKVFIADTFAEWANAGFNASAQLSLVEAWCASLSYTMQIYYDFSGYTDMAIGSALLFNIQLPKNFNSPYKALNIQDFWRRWHMTLSRWLRDYVYIPLGGNRGGLSKVSINLLLTFLIGGLWHGAGWTFLMWGALHGGACVLFLIWSHSGRHLPKFFSWALTFMFINITWVFFRAENFPQAWDVLSAMFAFNTLTPDIILGLSDVPIENLMTRGEFQELFPWIAVFLLVAVYGKNTNTVKDWRIPITLGVILTVILFLLGSPDISQASEFLYFNF
jgi:D-alanyl-lipoteichoic acid acyltransferase DltB (MBOAT superfamily)